MGQTNISKGSKPPGGLRGRALRAVGRELKTHPLRYSFRVLLISYFGYVLANQQMLTGHMQPLLFWCFWVYCCLTAYRLVHPIWDKGQQVEDWAIVQQEHQTMQQLSEDTPENLEKLLNYHMKYGNIKAADRISQKLLVVTESGSQPPAPSVQPLAQPELKLSAGLPTWLEGQVKEESGETIKLKGEPEQQAQKPQQEEQNTVAEKLPDWMK